VRPERNEILIFSIKDIDNTRSRINCSGRFKAAIVDDARL